MSPELVFIERLAASADQQADAAGQQQTQLPVLSLPYERRQIARQRVTLDDGQEAGLKLPRGTVLRSGDLLRSDTNIYARVNAAEERVSLVRCTNPHDLARAAYHLGNRHVWVQIGADWVRYLHDHVLDEMIAGLGLSVVTDSAPFEPESGAYSNTGSHHHGEHHHSH